MLSFMIFSITFNGVDFEPSLYRPGPENRKSVSVSLRGSSKGSLKKIKFEKFTEQIDWDLLYEKIPAVIPGITKDDVKNAYMSELEAFLEAFM